MTDDLVAFLRARLDEDERVALDALPLGHWEVRGRHHVYKANGPPSLPPVASYAIGEAEHIARHDPARVLADVAAKRAIVDQMAGMLAAAQGDSEVDHYGALSAAEEPPWPV